jgi:type I restriction enzyme S subunit
MRKENSLPELPEGWVWTRLEEIAGKLQSGGTPLTKVKKYYENGKIPFVKIKDMVNENKYLYDTETKITEEGLNNSSAWLVPENSLLYSMYASYGVPAINKVKVATSQAIIVFLPPDDLIYVDYLYHFLWSIKPFLRTYIREMTQDGIRGTTQDNLNAAIVSNLPTPLPPLPEQYRIVAKIEELLTKLDAGVEALKKVKAQLKRHRQAVLKSAFEGKLTDEWRKAHKGEIEPASMFLERIKEERKKKAKGKYKELPPSDTSELPKPPEGWVWTRLGEVTEIILGQSPPSSTYNENGDGLPFYQGKLEFGNFYPTPRKWCTAPKKIAEKGDVLISVRAPVGPTNICPEKSCIGRGLAAIRGLGGIETFFILYSIRTFEHNLAGKGIGTTFKAITGGMLKEFAMSLPPLAEQHKIVEEIERRLSAADEVEKVVRQNLKRAERLRQSILKRAFEGKLVPQDLSDEPAEKLLERIKAEKAKQESKKKGRRKTKRKRFQKERGR